MRLRPERGCAIENLKPGTRGEHALSVADKMLQRAHDEGDRGQQFLVLFQRVLPPALIIKPHHVRAEVGDVRRQQEPVAATVET